MNKTRYKFIVLALFIFIIPYVSNANTSEVKINEISYGTSFSGKKLIAFKIFKAGKFSFRRMALLTDGIHGNEYTGVGDDFIKEIKENKKTLSAGLNKFLSSGGILLIVPKVNPDGVSKGSRYSTLGNDLNRDFNRVENKGFFSQQETFYLDQLIKTQTDATTQLVLAVDYHCCAKSLLYPPTLSSSSQKVMKGFYEQIFKSLKESLGTKYVLATSSSVFGEKLEGTMKNYWFSEYGTISFTFEGYRPSHDKSQSEKHLKWWGSMLGYVSSLSHQSLSYLQELPSSHKDKSLIVNSKTLKYSE